MIAILCGMGAALCVFLLILMLSKSRRALGDGWLTAWLSIHLIFFITFGAAQIVEPPTALIAFALAGQCAVALLAPAQFLHAWALTAAPRRAGLLRAAWSLLLVAGILMLPALARLRVESGAILADAPAWLLLAPPLALLLAAAYPIAALARLSAYRAQLKQRLSNLHRAGLAWTAIWAYSTIVLLFWQAAIFAVSLTGAVSVQLHIGLLLCGQIAQIAFVGWRGLTETSLFSPDSGDTDAGPPDQSDLDAARADFETLKTFIATNEPHLDSELTAADLADRLGWAPFRLTQALRLGGGGNFHDFINRARVETVKRMALDPRYARTAFLTLAFDAGFGSKSAFYEAFNAAEGMAPARWRAQQSRLTS